MFRVRLALILVVLLAACDPGSTPPDPIVDGWPIGAEQSCSPDDARCTALMPAALSFFEQHNRQHQTVVRATLHREGSLVDAQGTHILMTRSGACCSVALLELADGSIRAIGVGYPGVSQTPMAFDIGP